MRLLKTRMAAAFLTVTMTVGLSACGGSEATTAGGPAEVTPPGNLVSSGTLTYGTAATFPPFESKSADGGLEGFDIDMIESLASSMGLGTKALDTDFDGLIPALTGKRTDIVNSAMYMTDERAEQVDFVPYLVIGEALLTPRGNPKKISRVPEDLSGRTIAVTRGAIGETYMEEYNKELKKKGLKQMDIMTLPSNQDAMMAVKSGRADAFDTSTPGAATTLAKTDDYTVAATFKNETKIGIAVRKGDTKTAAALREALDLFVKSGDYDKLLSKYKLPDEADYFDTGSSAPASPSGSAPASVSADATEGS
ncbi:ABC transporter substrate-binding protein [Streptomyces sp. BH-SS-21]|uniref:ABC transporter substrate-binding protein n=1 Tax=Streptomyces liliiviolaceus TaxID=2823109 RepID=A0A940Y2Z1_9ACTN|nr:ABC transporter substrate-binding protein [Streptomyces liliiviolaceus]MBQ0854588.1 ABC transporter substrate-binding protein [Streptomyces liliiviolaceus]